MQRMSPNEIDFEDLNKISTKISLNEDSELILSNLIRSARGN